MAIEAMGEAFSLVRKFGVEAEALYDVMSEGALSSPVRKGYGRLIVEAYDKAGFTAELAIKDVRLVLAAARAVNAPLPAVNVLHDRLISAIAHGHTARVVAVVAEEQSLPVGLD